MRYIISTDYDNIIHTTMIYILYRNGLLLFAIYMYHNNDRIKEMGQLRAGTQLSVKYSQNAILLDLDTSL